MNVITLDIFNTTFGMMVLFKFPEGIVPKIDMKMKRNEDVYVIKGIVWGKRLDHLEQNIFSCNVETMNAVLQSGDVLQIL